MPDLIHLLPDHIANQIAAGEVIQRPASALKELLENAVDAGATAIEVEVQDAGKSLLQVSDNGRGMSAQDAGMAFERHATSKIQRIEDLFSIRTMGFRGEALASMAAVAQMVMHTRRAEDETGTLVEVENSHVRRQEPVAWTVGTRMAMKNLFFNVPARRNFLKSNAAELRHILEEFSRVALAYPELFFSLSHNGQQIYHLEKGSLKQRIVQLLGLPLQSKLVAVEENTDYLQIRGFVGKPESAKKTRGDQYFFVNRRFIRSPYLHHAVMSAFSQMIPAEHFPVYVLQIELDPAQVDVNVHPTKQEIKFEDERIVYAFVQAAVKHALAQYSITPTLDFDLDPQIQRLDAVAKPLTAETAERVQASSLFRTFSQKNQAHFLERDTAPGLEAWKALSQSLDILPGRAPEPSLHAQSEARFRPQDLEHAPVFQLFGKYILATLPGATLLVDQRAAHERVVFEKYESALSARPLASQQSMFATELIFSPVEEMSLEPMRATLLALGYRLEPSGNHTYLLQGTPQHLSAAEAKADIEFLIGQAQQDRTDPLSASSQKLIQTLAARHVLRPGTLLTAQEMKALVADLLACREPSHTYAGQQTFLQLRPELLEALFSNALV